ncbi:hypothetical protein ABCS64_07310 [Rhodocyclaceae bacterium Wk13]|uniref:Uncharacterized protein n=1 Tax=Dentiradicibacter hellwigii TaxID=3149053 RepID=A0ABV4UEQ2_9RHOO
MNEPSPFQKSDRDGSAPQTAQAVQQDTPTQPDDFRGLAVRQRLIWYNVHLNNPDAAGESAVLLAEKTDVLALAEINLNDPGWQVLRTHYPHGCQHQEASPFALALWSAAPLASCDIAYGGDPLHLHHDY